MFFFQFSSGKHVPTFHFCNVQTLLGCPRKLGSKVIGSVGSFTPSNTPFISR